MIPFFPYSYYALAAAIGAVGTALVSTSIVLDSNTLGVIGALVAFVGVIIGALRWLDKRILEKVKTVVREMKIEGRAQREKERLHTQLILHELRQLRIMVTGKDEPRLELPDLEPERVDPADERSS